MTSSHAHQACAEPTGIIADGAVHRGDSADHLVAPAAVRLIELDEPLRDIELNVGAKSYRTALLLFRDAGVVLGTAVVAPDAEGRVPADLLLDIAEGWRRDTALQPAAPPPTVDALTVSVVIPTCGNELVLDRCLRSVLACGRADDIVVVDNRPDDRSTRAFLDRCYGDVTAVRYVAERRPGLSYARNAGISAATGDVITFLDDDVVADRHVLDRLVQAFAADAGVACVTGLIVPLELETTAQVQLEQFATFGKGFDTRSFTLDAGRASDSSFPYAAG